MHVFAHITPTRHGWLGVGEWRADRNVKFKTLEAELHHCYNHVSQPGTLYNFTLKDANFK
jgi:hypothetical protein